MVRWQAATLPPASKVSLPVIEITAMGFRAASTALSALTMPAPHSLPSLGQAHSPEPVLAEQTGTPAGCGKGLELDSMRAISWAGVKFALTACISAAIPETMGAEKLVPRFGFS